MVYDIFAGGQGSKTVAANVDTATITMNNGVALSLIGGGYLKSTVKNSTITLTGGVVGNIHGGGYGIGVDYITSAADAVGTATNPEQSLCVVEKVKINATGGRVHDGNEGWGAFYGGGYGFQYVKDVEINIGGTFGKIADTTYVTAAGANGRTDKAKLNITGGEMSVVQTVNRGSVGEVYVKMTGGKVTDMYAGGETGDGNVNGVISNKTVLSLSKGEITSLTAGKSGGTLMAPNSPLMEVYLKDTSDLSLGNDIDVMTLFGTSVKPLFVDETFGELVFEVEELEEIPAETFENIKELGLAYGYPNEEYNWTFKGTDVTDATIPVNPEITVLPEAPEDIKEDLDKLIPAGEKVLFLDFAHEGALPGKATISLMLSPEEYKAGDVLYIAHYNETKKALEKPIRVVVQEQESLEDEGEAILFIEFDITECSTYVVSRTSLVPNPDTSDNILFYVGLGIIGLFTTIAIVNKKKIFN